MTELDSGDQRRVGSAYRATWRAGVVPYRVRFDFRVEGAKEPLWMTGTARGALAGAGTWRLFEQDGVCAVTFHWQVRATRAWMKGLAPLASPLFAAGHHRLMRRGGEGLAARMGVRLLAAG